jgi:hypothetical protein
VSLCSQGWPKLAPAPFNAERLEAAVDILRDPGRRDEWPALRAHVIDRRGCSPAEADALLRRLADYLRRPTEAALLAEDTPAPCEFDAIENRYESMVRQRVGHTTGHRARLRADFAFTVALDHLRAPSPAGAGLDLADAHQEMLAGSPLAKHALALARKKVNRLGATSRWDPAEMLDHAWGRYETPFRLVPAHGEAVSLDELAVRVYERPLGFMDTDRDRLVLRRYRRPSNMRYDQQLKDAAIRRAQARSAGFKPNGLNVAVQPWVRGERAIETLTADDIRSHYPLPPGRVGVMALVQIKRCLRFRPAVERLLQLTGHSPQEAQDVLAEMEQLHDTHLRREVLRQITGVKNVFQYREHRNVCDERTGLLRDICISLYGHYQGHDLLPRLT